MKSLQILEKICSNNKTSTKTIYSKMSSKMMEMQWWCLVQKNQNFELNWNLIHRLIRIFKIQWWHWLFSVFDQKIPLLGKLGPKNQICQLSCDSVPKLIPTHRIKWKCSLFLFLTWNFWRNLVQKVKTVTTS